MSLSCVTILGCTTILFRVQLPKYALMQWRVCVEVPLNLLSNQTSGASSSLSVTTLPNLWMDTSSIAFTLTFFRMFLVHHIKFVYIFICIVHYLSSLYIFLCISLTWVCQDALTLSLLLLFRSRIANSIKVENLQREWACEHWHLPVLSSGQVLCLPRNESIFLPELRDWCECEFHRAHAFQYSVLGCMTDVFGCFCLYTGSNFHLLTTPFRQLIDLSKGTFESAIV